jgi:biopolymer transport protein ExbD
MAIRRSHAPPGIHDPNLTPLIDVSLVLVVILLVATPFALQSGIGVARAPQSGKTGAAFATRGSRSRSSTRTTSP